MGFPNLKNKHAKDSMFTPSEFMAYQKKLGKYPKFKPPIGVIFCYDRNLMEFILENHKTTKVEGFYGEMYLLDETNGKVAVIGKFGIGAPVVVTLLEELIAFGIKKFISIGTAGTLQKDIKIGSLVVCEKAIRDEGTSHHYLKSSKYAYASKEMTNKIKKSLDKLKQKYIVGTSWTIDAPYRETVAEARQYQKEGVATVEMEASALFAVAQYRNVELGALFTISDSLAELEWKPKFHLKKTKKGLEILYKVAVDVLLNH
ncbi:MAG: purine phosphorylase [Bacteroidetes bacterium]|nr:MAG: purine phosphorylase [Bacteroidota bacterium]